MYVLWSKYPSPRRVARLDDLRDLSIQSFTAWMNTNDLPAMVEAKIR